MSVHCSKYRFAEFLRVATNIVCVQALFKSLIVKQSLKPRLVLVPDATITANKNNVVAVDG
jgi:hypothetical protein